MDSLPNDIFYIISSNLLSLTDKISARLSSKNFRNTIPFIGIKIIKMQHKLKHKLYLQPNNIKCVNARCQHKQLYPIRNIIGPIFIYYPFINNKIEKITRETIVNIINEISDINKTEQEQEQEHYHCKHGILIKRFVPYCRYCTLNFNVIDSCNYISQFNPTKPEDIINPYKICIISNQPCNWSILVHLKEFV